MKRFDVGREQFPDGAVLQNVCNHRVLVKKPHERVLIGRIFIPHILLGLDFRIQLELLKKEHTYLLGRQYVQIRFAGILAYAFLNLREFD